MRVVPVPRPAVPPAPGGWRASLGLATILVGQPIAWTVRGAVGGGINPVYPIVAVALGLALMARIDWFRAPRFYPAPRPVAALVLLWLVPLAALSLLAPLEVGIDGAYALFLVAVALGLSLTPIAALGRLPEAMTVVGGVSSILPLGNLFFGHVVAKFARLTVAGTDNQAIAGAVGGTTMIAALLVIRTGTGGGAAVGLGAAIAFVAGLAGVALSNTRSVMLFLLVCLPLVWFYFGPRLRPASAPLATASVRGQRRTFALVVAAAVIGAPSAATAIFEAKARDAIIDQFSQRIEGTFGFLDASKFRVLDTSSQLRVHILDYTVRRLDLVGHGISEEIRSGFGFYPHLAYLQAFYDFGVAGGLLYLVLALLIPAMLIIDHLRHRRLNPASAFIMLYYIYGLGDQFGHTTPYAWQGLATMVLVYVVVGRAGPMPSPRAGTPASPDNTVAKRALTTLKV